MPQPAVHKSKDKKRKGAEASGRDYSRRLQDLDEDPDIPIGRITKMLRADRYIVSFWHAKKKQLMEVQAAVVDRNVERMKPQIGNYVAVVESGSHYEIFLPLKDADASHRNFRIHRLIQNTSTTAGGPEDDAGIEFDYGDEGVPVEGAAVVTATGTVAKKDKATKHTERQLREENDGSGGDDEDVNVDDI